MERVRTAPAMKGVTVPAYGTFELRDLPAPALGDDDVLVDVAAASINAADRYVLAGKPFPVRFSTGLLRPSLRALGADVAGTIRAVGARVSGLAVGDEVVADLSADGFGAFAEEVAAPARAWVKKPSGVSFAEAAAAPMAGMTALKALRDVAAVRDGERVLVVGAASGVGSFAVQIARALGATVTAACRPEKTDAVRSVGVTDFVDQGSLRAAMSRGELAERFDVVLDCAAYGSAFAYRRALRHGGRYVLVGGGMAPLFVTGLIGPLVGLVTGRRFQTFIQIANASLLAEVLALLAAGKVRSLVDRTFPLADIGAALRYVEGREVRGKVVLAVRR